MVLLLYVRYSGSRRPARGLECIAVVAVVVVVVVVVVAVATVAAMAVAVDGIVCCVTATAQECGRDAIVEAGLGGLTGQRWLQCAPND